MCRLTVHPLATMPKGLAEQVSPEQIPRTKAGPESRAQSGAQSGAQSRAVLTALTEGPRSASELVELLRLGTKTGAFKRSMKNLLEQGCIAYTIPNKPTSRLQKYRLTDRGRAWLQES